MVKVKYIGDKKECRVRAGSVIINKWERNTIRDLCPIAARKIVQNKEFVLADEKDIIKDIKRKEEKIVEVSNINFDLNNDGVIDSKDMSIAGKVLAAGRKKKKQMKEDSI